MENLRDRLHQLAKVISFSYLVCSCLVKLSSRMSPLIGKESAVWRETIAR